jgi:hypothetical protein
MWFGNVAQKFIDEALADESVDHQHAASPVA